MIFNFKHARTLGGHRAEYFLSRFGGTLAKGSVLSFARTDNSTLDGILGIGFYNNLFEIWERGGKQRGVQIDISKCGVSSELLHTGNKPTGTYTGNGSATERKINIGGVHGDVNDGLLYVYGQDTGSGVLVFNNGAVTFRSDKGIQVLSAEHCYFHNGVLTLTTTETFLNGSGAIYNYRFL